MRTEMKPRRQYQGGYSANDPSMVRWCEGFLSIRHQLQPHQNRAAQLSHNSIFATGAARVCSGAALAQFLPAISLKNNHDKS
jgi:hypothetical protein